MGTIYGLRDPRTGKIRYVGQTIKARRYRLHAHLHAARNGEQTHCARWLRKLLEAGVEPEVAVLARVSREHLDAAERAWIRAGKKLGWRLTNIADGGGTGRLANPDEINPMEYPSVRRRTARKISARWRDPEFRKKMRVRQVAAQRKRRERERRNGGVSDEFRERCSRASRGRKLTKKHRAKLSKAQRRRHARGLPESHLENLRKAQRARRARERATGTGCASEEFRRNCRRAQSGRKITKKARKNMGAAQARRAKREGKKVRGDRMRAVWKDPEFRAKHSKRMKEAWADPEKRAKMLAGRKKK